MIKYIKGTYAMMLDNSIIVENTSGIGFEIFIPKGSPLYKYSEGDEIMVFTEMVVKEDDISLYGFHNKESLEMFKILTTVSGIGPKGAMSLMGAMPLDELKRAIIFEDAKSISSAPGVGKKTAERIVLELKDKVGKMDESITKVSLSDISSDESSSVDQRSEAIQALVALGYSRAEAFSAVSHVSEDNLTSEEYIKKALKSLF